MADEMIEAVESPSVVLDKCSVMLADVLKQAEPTIRRAAEQFYEDILIATQDYLIQNADWNLSAEIERHDRTNRRNATLLDALQQIAGIRERPYLDFPQDFQEQTDACPECQGYKNHPVQHGICNTHMRHIYRREEHDANETRMLGSRLRRMAQEAIEKDRA